MNNEVAALEAEVKEYRLQVSHQILELVTEANVAMS